MFFLILKYKSKLSGKNIILSGKCQGNVKRLKCGNPDFPDLPGEGKPGCLFEKETYERLLVITLPTTASDKNYLRKSMI